MGRRVLWQKHYDEREELMKNLKIIITLITKQIGSRSPEMWIVQDIFNNLFELTGNTFAAQ